MSEQNYDVGFGKPPKSGQFAKGRSGNPTGRPRGSRNANTIFNRVLQETIRVTENGKVRRISKFEAITRQLTGKALSGDLRAIKQIVEAKQSVDTSPDPSSPNSPDTQKNQAMLRNFTERLMRTHGLNPTATEDEKGDEK